MSKYHPLRDHLRRAGPAAVEMGFDEIDQLVGGLPSSARHHRAWWANESDGAHVQARAWLDSGRRVEVVDPERGRVRFSGRID